MSRRSTCMPAGRRQFLHSALAGTAALSGSLIGLSAARAAEGPARAPLIIRMPGGIDANDRRTTYAQRVLQLAMEKSGEPFRTLVLPGMTVPRTVIEMQDGHVEVCVLASMAPDFPGMQPIRIPLRRGLLGVRLLLATRARAAEIARVPDLATLKQKYRYGSGADWVDRSEFERLGFRVVTGVSYTGLFDMLRSGRFDLFSRGVTEVYGELDNPQLGQGLAVVPGIALSYPLDSYFYVSDRAPGVRAALERGLNRARQDGSLNALMLASYGDSLRRAALHQRRWLPVTDYAVPPGTPLQLFDLASPAAVERLGLAAASAMPERLAALSPARRA
ncbi:MAG TPA: hypothetical protein VFK82_10505 [Burkholderiaceae bacterium]|nr:hypothetical protein [Burkholderiaceae bacterium]